MSTEQKTVAQLKAELKALDVEISEAENKDWVEYAQGIMDQMFQDFSAGAEFLDKSANQAIEDLHVMSPIGRRRNLWRSITGRPGVIAAARRRAQNSPIQGFSSELGSSAGVLIQESTNDYMEDFGYDPELFPLYCRAVHDCNVFCTKYEMVIPHIHIMQYEATYGLQTWAEDTFGMKFTITPEIELEISATDDNSFKWDWSLNNLSECIAKSLADQIKLGDIESVAELKDAYKKIVAPWRDKEQRAFLQEHYPLLNVKNLDKQIDGFLVDFKKRVTDLAKELQAKEEAYEA